MTIILTYKLMKWVLNLLYTLLRIPYLLTFEFVVQLTYNIYQNVLPGKHSDITVLYLLSMSGQK